MIEVIGINKSFGANKVITDIDFSFYPGKINMIIGISGSGKSTLLKCMVGLLKPDSGRVMFDGINFHNADFQQKREVRKQIGMLFQASALFDSMTVFENVAFPIKTFTKNSKKEIEDRVHFCLDRVNLSSAGKLYPSELSGGMKKRVGIARAIAMNPRYLFVDEPNSGLDPLTASLIDELILELTREYQMTTVVVSHDMNSVLNIGDHILFIHNAKKEWSGSNKEVLTTDNVELNRFVFVSDFLKSRKHS
jgi:phospholipid/cholesterol/gamma-HCH transport system ATP-binding protein